MVAISPAPPSDRFFLPEHKPLPSGPRLYQMERAFSGGAIPASTQGLSVDGDDLPVGLLLDSARLCPKTALKLRRLDLAENSG
jgi:hypothetical protein